MKYKREIEKKYVIQGKGYTDCVGLLDTIGTLIASANSRDHFWEVPGVDFLRLRENSREITVKVTDKGTVTDRIEENVVVEDFPTAKRLLRLVYGNPTLTLTKQFEVYNLKDTIVCLYMVEEDPQQRVFLEVEGDNMDSVDRVANSLSDTFKMVQESRSLFQIFMEALR